CPVPGPEELPPYMYLRTGPRRRIAQLLRDSLRAAELDLSAWDRVSARARPPEWTGPVIHGRRAPSSRTRERTDPGAQKIAEQDRVSTSAAWKYGLAPPGICQCCFDLNRCATEDRKLQDCCYRVREPSMPPVRPARHYVAAIAHDPKRSMRPPSVSR